MVSRRELNPVIPFGTGLLSRNLALTLHPDQCVVVLGLVEPLGFCGTQTKGKNYGWGITNELPTAIIVFAIGPIYTLLHFVIQVDNEIR